MPRPTKKYVDGPPGKGNPNGPSSHPVAEPTDFLERARVFWEVRTERPLTREDAREIMGNLTGFFQVLSEWDQAERLAKRNRRTSEAKEEEQLTPSGNGRLI